MRSLIYGYGDTGKSFERYLKDKKIDIEKKLKSNQPTIPSTLADEIKTNIFLRCDDPEIKHGLGLKDSSDVEVFSKLRDLKDSF